MKPNTNNRINFIGYSSPTTSQYSLQSTHIAQSSVGEYTPAEQQLLNRPSVLVLQNPSSIPLNSGCTCSFIPHKLVNNTPSHSRNRLSQLKKSHIESNIVSSHGRVNTKAHPKHHSFSECQSSRVLGAVKSSNLRTCSGSEPATYKTSVLPYQGRIAFQHLSLRSAASVMFEKSCSTPVIKQSTCNRSGGDRCFTCNLATTRLRIPCSKRHHTLHAKISQAPLVDKL